MELAAADDDLLADEDLSQMPDRRITLMGQQQELESLKEGSFVDAPTSEKILLKNEEIERLQEQLT